jgi:hypothetical protein
MLLSEEAAKMMDPITYEDLADDDAYYIAPNVHKNTIHHLYSGATIQSLFNMRHPRSPFTQRPLSPEDIRQYRVVRELESRGIHPGSPARRRVFEKKMKSKRKIMKTRPDYSKYKNGPVPMNWEYTTPSYY